MKTKPRVSMLAFALALSASTAGAARADAPQRNVFSFHGLNGLASWFTFDGSCSLTSVTVIGNENVLHDPGSRPVTTTDVTLLYTIANFCTQEFRNGSGSGTGTLSGNLQQLTIQGTIPINDSAGSTSATVDVTLTATSAATHQENNFHAAGPTMVVQVRSVGATAPGTAAGSVVIDGVDLLANLGPGTASLSTTDGGTITIIH
jgi:hypothetical protein